MDILINRKMLLRFLENNCNPEECEAIERWLQNEENSDELKSLMLLHWHATRDEQVSDVNLKHVLRNLHVAMEVNNIYDIKDQHIRSSEKHQSFSHASYHANAWKILLAVASIIIMVSSGFYFFIPDVKAGVENWTELTSRKGKVTCVKLPDGTQVWLNADTKLRYKNSLAGRTREVYLEGEGLFDVSHDKRRLFIVHAKDVTIKVFGTRFNVKSYRNQDNVETTLIQGKVFIEKRNSKLKRIELKPNQRVVYNSNTAEIKVSEVNALQYTTWQISALNFEEESLREVINVLEQWYGVTIHITQDQNLSCKFTAHLRKESLQETLELLKSTTPITYTIQNKDVYIVGKLCE